MDISSIDIVERLREGTRGTDITKTDVALNSIMSEAADEIVKLRSSLFRVQNWLQDAHLVLDKSIKETVEALDE